MSTLCVTKLNKINDFLVLHVFSVFCPFVGRSYNVYFKSIYSFDHLFFCLFPNIFFILLNDFADIFSFNLFCMIESSSCISQYFYSSILFSIQIFPLSGSSIPSFTTCFSNLKFIPIDLAICIYVTVRQLQLFETYSSSRIPTYALVCILSSGSSGKDF